MSATERPRANTIELADGVMLAVVVLWASNNVLTKAALFFSLFVAPARSAARHASGSAPVHRQRSLRIHLLQLALCRGAIPHLRVFRGDPGVIGADLHSDALGGLETGASASVAIGRGRALIPGRCDLYRRQAVGGEPAIGELLNVVAALCFAIYGLTTRPLLLKYGPETTTAWAVLIGLVAVIPVTARAMLDENWSSLGGFQWFSITYAAVVSVMIGYSLWGWAITRTGAGRSVPYLFLIPVFTGLFSVVFRNDHLEVAQLIGGAIAMAGVAIARIFARPANQIAAIIAAKETGMTPDSEPQPRAVAGP